MDSYFGQKQWYKVKPFYCRIGLLKINSFSHHTLIDRLEWCGLLWWFYQLFGLSFWRHPFTAEDSLVNKWCNATFLKICFDEETNSSTSWTTLGWVRFDFWVNYSVDISFKPISDAWSFIEFKGYEGRTGMASVTLKKDHQFEPEAIFSHVTTYLPSYARPRFLRIQVTSQCSFWTHDPFVVSMCMYSLMSQISRSVSDCRTVWLWLALSNSWKGSW